MTHRPLRVCFLTRSLDAGAAQRQLAELVRRLDKRSFEVTVLTFYPGGLLRGDIAEAPGVRLVCLDKASRWDAARFSAPLGRGPPAPAPGHRARLSRRGKPARLGRRAGGGGEGGVGDTRLRPEPRLVRLVVPRRRAGRGGTVALRQPRHLQLARRPPAPCRTTASVAETRRSSPTASTPSDSTCCRRRGSRCGGPGACASRSSCSAWWGVSIR